MEVLKFRYFVIFADMRTGSNFLEENINQFADLQCFGELFNPFFIGGPNREEIAGIDMPSREANPHKLIDAISALDRDVIPGFRFFSTHDERILGHCLNDTNCAKVILTRNPLDSYVSHKIAAQTNQWKLTNVKHQKSAKVAFSQQEFDQHLDHTQDFQLTLLHGLQHSGQTAFYIHYDDLFSCDVINGLARFLGSHHQVSELSKTLKKQNPAALKDKVTNFAEMEASLGAADFAALFRTPDFEPRRGAAVPSYVAAQAAPLLFAPIKGGPVKSVVQWLQAHDEDPTSAPLRNLNQKTLREWQRKHPGYQSFTVARHPVARAHASFCTYILSPRKAAYQDIRETIRHRYNVRIPKKGAGASGYDLQSHKAAFSAFLTFLRANLAGKTSVRIDPAWATQTAVLQGFSTVLPIRHVFLETSLEESLGYVEAITGLRTIPLECDQDAAAPFALSDIYDAEVEAAVRQIYLRDYLTLGFGDWA